MLRCSHSTESMNILDISLNYFMCVWCVYVCMCVCLVWVCMCDETRPALKWECTCWTLQTATQVYCVYETYVCRPGPSCDYVHYRTTLLIKLYENEYMEKGTKLCRLVATWCYKCTNPLSRRGSSIAKFGAVTTQYLFTVPVHYSSALHQYTVAQIPV